MRFISTVRNKFFSKRRVKIPAIVGVGTLLLPSFAVEARLGQRSDDVKVGDNSVLGCRITLEREIGNVIIGNNTYIGKGTNLICAHAISVGSNVLISWGCTLIDHDSHSIHWVERTEDVQKWREGLRNGIEDAAALKDWSNVLASPIRIGDKVWIGFNTIVIKSVTIGEGAVIGAGSVVTKDVPSWTVAAGNPARVIRELDHD